MNRLPIKDNLSEYERAVTLEYIWKTGRTTPHKFHERVDFVVQLVRMQSKGIDPVDAVDILLGTTNG